MTEAASSLNPTRY